MNTTERISRRPIGSLERRGGLPVAATGASVAAPAVVLAPHRRERAMTLAEVLPHAMVALFAMAAFGPYLISMVRTEQAVVYAATAACAPFAIGRFRPSRGAFLFLPWCLLFATGVLGVLSPYPFPPGIYPSSLLAGVDNMLLPIAIMISVWTVVPVARAMPVFETFARFAIWCAAGNGLLSIVSTQVDLTPLLSRFWTGGTQTNSVAARIVSAGRFGGVFNQPGEAGVVYGVAALLTVFVLSRRPTQMVVAFTLITLGGFAVVGKIFILGGLPLSVLFLFLRRSVGGKLILAWAGIAVMLAISQFGLLTWLPGYSNIVGLAAGNKQESYVALYTGGRIGGADLTLRSTSSVVLEHSPLAGFGFAGVYMPYDAGWIEALAIAGLIGAACYTATLLAVFRMAFIPKTKDLRTFVLLLAAFLAGASFGLPALTANRAATIVWTLLALLVLVCRADADTQDPPGRPSLGPFRPDLRPAAQRRG